MVSGIDLLIDGRCKMRCHYCYRGGAGSGAMPDSVLDQAIQQLVRAGPNTCCSLIGGEPLYCSERLKNVVTRIKHATTGVKLSMTTAGPYIDDLAAMVQFLKDAGVHITLSLDGPKHIHEKQRLGYGASHESAMQWLAQLSKAGCKVVLRATLDPSIWGNDLPMREAVQWLVSTCQEHYVAGFHIEIASNMVEQLDCAAAVDSAVAWYYRAQPRIVWAGVYKAHQLLASGSSVGRACGQGCSVMAVDQQGQLWPCHRMPGSPLGTVQDGILVSAVREWMMKVQRARSRCRLCTAWPICRGGCAAEDIDGVLSSTACNWRRSFAESVLTNRRRESKLEAYA